MAFTISNQTPSSGSDLFWIVGAFTSIDGDTSGTISVGGTQIYLAQFTNYDADNGEIRFLPVSYSTSGNITTITVNLSASAVTNGRFIIAYR